MRVNIELAKLLKEKGYDVPCKAYWTEPIMTAPFIDEREEAEDYNNLYSWTCSAPELHEVAEWLIEVKKIHVAAVPDGFGNKENLIWHAIVWVIYESLNPQPYIVRNELDEIIVFDTRNQAIEAAIVKALKKYVK